jgi:DNA-binding transcriptional MerR regulator
MDADFTSDEVSRLAGFKKRWMLEHLEREKTFIRENHEDRANGRRRKYTFGDLLILRAINRMLELGARPARIRQVINCIRDIEGFPSTREAARQATTALGKRLFVTAETAFWVSNEEEVVDLIAKGQLAFGFMISIRDVAGEIVPIVDQYVSKRLNKRDLDIPMLDALCEACGL